MIEKITEIDKNILKKRGEGTRYALIMAGLELFGEYGVKGTSTRMLSKNSGANISAIPYHFDSKNGLYIAVVEYIIERMATYNGEVRSEIRVKLENSELNKEESLEAIKKIMGGMARLFVESDEPKAWAQIIMREQANPTAAFDILYKSQIQPMQKILGKLISNCTGLDENSDEVKVRGHAMFGQMLGFLVSRESILRNLGVKKLQDKHVELIHKILISNAEVCLTTCGGKK